MLAFTTLANPAPAAARTAARFSITRSVCARTSPCTICCVCGSSGIWPLTKTSSPATIPCEYGPIAFGALSVDTVWWGMRSSCAGRAECATGRRRSSVQGHGQCPREIAPAPGHHGRQPEPRAPCAQLGGERRKDGRAVRAPLEPGADDQQAARHPVRLEIDARHQPIAEEEGQDVSAPAALF